MELKGTFSLIYKRKKETINFGSLIKCFQVIMEVAKKIQSLVSSTTLIVLKISTGLEN